MADRRKFNISNVFHNFNWKKRLIMYVAVILLAVAYIFIFSDSNYRVHKKYNNKIKELEVENEKQKKNVEIQSTYEGISDRKDSLTLERYRREQLNMKKPDEDLFIIK